jgi:hypothetical protein
MELSTAVYYETMSIIWAVAPCSEEDRKTICTSTISKLRVTYTLTWRRELSSAPLESIGSRPVVAEDRTFRSNFLSPSLGETKHVSKSHMYS